MKSEDFISMVNCFVKKYDLNIEETDILVQWKYDRFHIVFNGDGRPLETFYLITSMKKVQDCDYGHSDIRPCNFETNENAMYADRTVLKTIKLNYIVESLKNEKFKNIEILISTNGNLPKNMICDINPYKCKIVRCYNTNKPILVLYVDQRNETEKLNQPNDHFSYSDLKDVDYWENKDDECCSDGPSNYIKCDKISENL